jgi:polysaccharide export outer membrane protein
MKRRNQMRRKRVLRFSTVMLLGCALLVSFSREVLGQITMQQQMPNYSVGSPSPAATSRNQAGITQRSPASEMRIVPEDFPKLKLAPGFLVSLSVLDDTDFSGSFRVDERGDIAIPVLGLIHVAGETAGGATEQIKRKLQAKQMLVDPQVTLNVVEYTAPEVAILGEVSSPGRYPLLASRKLIDVLALAGGTTLLAGNEIRINSSDGVPRIVQYSRGSSPEPIENVYVQPGDTVQVKRAGVVYVLGAVNRPGGYVMQEEGTLNILQAISLANGTSPVAATKKIYLFRRNSDGTQIDMEVSYKSITRGKSSDLQLHATDVIFVPTSTTKSVLINGQGIVSAAAAAGIYAGTAY